MKYEEATKKANILIEALPYLKKFHKKIFVIKYGGSILSDPRIRSQVLEDIVFLAFSGIRPVLVHGGGTNINERLKKIGAKSEFYEGMRITSKEILEVVEEELDKINDILVKEIENMGANVQGFKTKERIFIVSKKCLPHIDLGFVGSIKDVNITKVISACNEHKIPVISPMGVSQDDIKFNVNADEAASFLSAKLKAEKLVFLTNVRGLVRKFENEEVLISSIDEKKAEELIREGVIFEGMIPKVRFGCLALKKGVGKAHILDARIPHSLLLEIFTDEGIGTEIVK